LVPAGATGWDGIEASSLASATPEPGDAKHAVEIPLANALAHQSGFVGRSEEMEALASELTRAALMGARGNSGVIFSQMLRGFAEVVAEAEQLDAPTLARAFRRASDTAYEMVTKPVEGTMLTVIREMAEEAESHVDGTSRELLAAVVRRGADAVERTPELLDVLRNAGVVDAGGAGLLEIVRGIAAALAGEPIPEAPEEELSIEAVHQELSKFRYCTVFVVEGEGLDRKALQAQFEPLGDSLLVVGDATAVKVHVHTDDPGAALALGTAVGTLEQVEIANMHKQTEQREERLLHSVPDAFPAVCEVVAVVAGAGNRALFEEYGATQIVEGGQSMNPSAAELVAAIDRARAPTVFVLPNNSNVILAAEQAAKLSHKDVRVIRTDSIPAGLAAIVAFEGWRDADANAHPSARPGICRCTTSRPRTCGRTCSSLRTSTRTARSRARPRTGPCAWPTPLPRT